MFKFLCKTILHVYLSLKKLGSFEFKFFVHLNYFLIFCLLELFFLFTWSFFCIFEHFLFIWTIFLFIKTIFCSFELFYVHLNYFYVHLYYFYVHLYYFKGYLNLYVKIVQMKGISSNEQKKIFQMSMKLTRLNYWTNELLHVVPRAEY